MAAEFTINDTAFDDLEYEATHSEVLTLTLEDAPAFDVSRVRYSVVVATDGAPVLTFSPSTGVPEIPGGAVTVTLPASGCHSYIIQCEINEGRDSTGRTNRAYTKRRGVSIRSANLGLRKWCPGETTEFSAAGWTEEQNAAVDSLDTYGLGGAGVISEVTGAAPIVSSGGTTPQISITAASNLAAGSMSAAHYSLLQDASDESDTSTLARRTADAALRAAFFEVNPSGITAASGDIRLPHDGSIVGMLSTDADATMIRINVDDVVVGSDAASTKIATVEDGNVELLHGPSATAFARFIASGSCASSLEMRLGDVRPRIYVAAWGDVPLITARDTPLEGRYQKTSADATATTATAMFPVTGPMDAVAHVLSAVFIPTAALTANDADWAQLNLYKIDDEGGLGPVISTVTTTITGLDGTGNWLARVPVVMPISDDEVPVGYHIGFSIAKGGAGVSVPSGLLVVKYVLVE